jgi:uncharacterized protein YjeT (DUF2065 family)
MVSLQKRHNRCGDRDLGEDSMDTKLYFTIAAIVAILFGIAFLLAPAQVSAVYGLTPNPASVLSSRFFGSALLAWGVILWMARDFSEAAAIRGVLIGSIVGEIVGGAVNVWGTVRGLMNGLAWTTTILYVLLLIGAIYCLAASERKTA